MLGKLSFYPVFSLLSSSVATVIGKRNDCDKVLFLLLILLLLLFNII